MAKIWRIDLSTQEVSFEDVKEEYKILGGRGLTSKIIADEVDPKCAPLGENNKLVFAPGILSSTVVPNNGRLSVGAKSPLTGTIKESNTGGASAQYLARLGIHAVIIQGKADKLTYLELSKESVKIRSAERLKGIGNLKTIEILRKESGTDNISIISIGQAGEMKLLSACISSTTPDFLPRMAARGGLGAVMGSKNLKAIVIRNTDKSQVEISDNQKLKSSAKQLAEGILKHPLVPAFENLGTAFLVSMINELGALPTKNFSTGRFEGAAKISGEHMAEVLSKRPNAKTKHRCMNGCLLSCSNIYTDDQGKIVTSGLEYETLGLVGANCMIDDLDTIAEIDRVCDDVGIDTMDTGDALAVAMEAGKIPWGDGDKVLAIIKEIEKGGKDGKVIGNGCQFTGKSLGVKRIPVVKGQAISSYDPRVLKGTGVTYATSTMGADHTCGNALPSPTNPDYNPTSSTGQGPISKFLQAFNAAIDTLGVCLFASLPLLDFPELQKHLIEATEAKLGIQLGDNYLMELGESVMKIEREFNERAGFSDKDDHLPDFFYKEKIDTTGTVFDVPDEEIKGIYV